MYNTLHTFQIMDACLVSGWYCGHTRDGGPIVQMSDLWVTAECFKGQKLKCHS
jgi:hypothetical protein